MKRTMTPPPDRQPRRDKSPAITFVRLTAIDPDVLVAHMSDPRMAEHMPLLTEPWTREFATRFIAAKEARWQRDGLGHWAILADGHYAGWGGFQKEGDEWDFGLVLRNDAFGLGTAIVARAMAFARAHPGIDHVTFLLPPTRRHLGALDRLGASFVGLVDHAGADFRKYRLSLPAKGPV